MTSNQNRVAAIASITQRSPMPVEMPQPLNKIWACDVFSLATMEDSLSKNAFKAMKKTVQTGSPLDPATADIVAAAMKEWALSRGVKFFSHIFYPMTNATAEKHDGFIITNPDGGAMTEFTGSLLIKGEPDGSSFPNGSLRMTAAARGYTAWDPTSPAFIMHTANGATLMIPSVFMSWTGEALDKKIPLLRSNAAMDTAARRVLTLMGETDIATLNSSCGAEQEYFLVEAALANARPDLLLAGRTLFGAAPAKGQEFDDHYFGAIPERVQVFMQDFEDKLYRLGIPAKTHHNEVAPGQFEIAPYFEAANDHRLGANEAPPAILSVYLGDQLEKVFMDIREGRIEAATKGGIMDLGLSQILTFERDPGDRNRTSPFAFTGNRFEFRAVGSSASVSGPLVTMNTMLADSLNWIADELEPAIAASENQTAAVITVLKKLMEAHGNVVFGGNGYSPEWHKMAVEERGLKNLPTSADALPQLCSDEAKALFSSTGVLSPTELQSRFEVYSEQYILSIEMEARLTIEMATTMIYPAAIQYLSLLAGTSAGVQQLGITLDHSVARKVAEDTDAMQGAVAKLATALQEHGFDSTHEHMHHCAYVIRPLMDAVRVQADLLETQVADSCWPLPKYRELLFIK
ncbi:MAG: glutamine synthetase III [Haliea sp.]|nr:glutamine synthetase III [Haliea sp.]